MTAMRHGSTLFLKIVIYLMGAAVLGLLLVVIPLAIPQAGPYAPILIGMYIPALPFFFGLYQGLKLLSYIDANTAFSERSITALHTIKYCAAAISLMYLIGAPYIYHVADLDDAPGVVLIDLVLIGAPLVIAVFAAVLEQLLQNAIDIKSENDLTV